MTTASELAPHVHDRSGTAVHYELHGNVAADLAEQLLTSHPPTSSRRFVCYALPGDGRFADLGRAVELEVFGAVFGDDREKLEAEYGPYDQASRFFVVMDQRRRRAAGVLRVIENSAVGLKTLNDVTGPLGVTQAEVRARHAIADLDRCWDVGTLAVRPEYRRSALRGRTVSLLLYRALWVAAHRAGVEHVVTVMDRHAHRVMLALGVPFVPVCDSGPFDYMGTPCTALHGLVEELPPAVEARSRRLRATSPLAWCLLAGSMRKLARGRGLDGRLQRPSD